MDAQIKFDRVLEGLTSGPNIKITRPSTILQSLPIVGDLTTYVVQTHRSADGKFTIFLQTVDSDGRARFILPDRVAQAIYRQRSALTDRSTPESRAKAKRSKERMKRLKAKAARRLRAPYVNRSQEHDTPEVES